MPTHGLKGLYNEDFLAVFVERLRTHVKLYELADAWPFLSLNQLLIVVNVFENGIMTDLTGIQTWAIDLLASCSTNWAIWCWAVIELPGLSQYIGEI